MCTFEVKQLLIIKRKGERCRQKVFQQNINTLRISSITLRQESSWRVGWLAQTVCYCWNQYTAELPDIYNIEHEQEAEGFVSFNVFDVGRCSESLMFKQCSGEFWDNAERVSLQLARLLSTWRPPAPAGTGASSCWSWTPPAAAVTTCVRPTTAAAGTSTSCASGQVLSALSSSPSVQLWLKSQDWNGPACLRSNTSLVITHFAACWHAFETCIPLYSIKTEPNNVQWRNVCSNQFEIEISTAPRCTLQFEQVSYLWCEL